jgi:phosphoribosylanthranilate isomerase
LDWPAGVSKVAVFVNEPLQELFDICRRLSVDLVQLHGGESAAYCREVRKAGIRLIKVFGMDHQFSFQSVAPFIALADYILFDTRTSNYGGGGKVFDWELLKDYHGELPFFLSGGIGPEVAGDLPGLRRYNNLYALDINSRFEISPGFKDIELIRKFRHALQSGAV